MLCMVTGNKNTKKKKKNSLIEIQLRIVANIIKGKTYNVIIANDRASLLSSNDWQMNQSDYTE